MESILQVAAKYYYAVPAALVGAFLVLLLLAWHRKRALTAALEAAPNDLADWNPGEPSESGLRPFLRAHLVGDEEVLLPGWRRSRRLISAEAADLFERFVEGQTSILRFTLGPMATAIALIFTFGLIGMVLTVDVRGALGSSDGSDARLSDAIGNLGLKFFISAAGIFVSLFYSVAVSVMRQSLFRAAHLAAEKCALLFCTSSAVTAAAQVRLVAEASASRERDLARAQEVHAIRAVLDATLAMEEAARDELGRIAEQGRRADARLGAIQDGIEKLKSIEVSVSNLGSEVTEQLRNMLTKDLGDQLQTMIGEIMKQAEELSADMRTKLLDGLERVMAREFPQILESLDAIKVSVQGQAESPIERLLEQLRGVVAGGIQSESSQMSAAMKEFAQVIPALADQLRTTAESLTTDMRSRTDASTAASESLISRIDGLLGKLDDQQASNQEFMSKAAEAAKSNALQLVGQIQERGSSLIEGLFSSSTKEVDALLTRLQAATASSSDSYGSLERSVSETSKSIQGAQEALAAATTAIRTIANETQSMMAETRQTHELARQASRGFESSAVTLQSGVEGMRSAVDGARTQAKEQGELLEQHRAALRELEGMWPKLFETYLRSFEQNARLLTNGWEEFYRKMGQVSQTVGEPLAEAAQELTISVDRLATLAKESHPA